MGHPRRIPSAFLFSFVISTSFNHGHLADAAKLRRGSVKPSDDIHEMSSLSDYDNSSSSKMRSLTSLSALTQAEIFAMKKTPPVSLMTSSKCGTSVFRKHHPLCTRSEEKEEEDTASKPPSIPLFAPPTGAPSSSPSLTSSPTRLRDLPLNCRQIVEGSELCIPPNTRYQRGDAHCLKLQGGDEIYFGYTWWNTFGLYYNSERVWTIPDDLVADFDRWVFQSDGNLVLRNAENNAIWTTQSHGNDGSRLKISKDRVWIETNSGERLWERPPYVEPSSSPSLSPPPTTAHPTKQPSPKPSPYPTTPFPSSSPTRLQDRPLECRQTVEGSELSVPSNTRYQQGDVLCLKVKGGEEAYFGLTWTGQFGLFVNGNETVWEVTDGVVTNLARWTFQDDGKLVLRNSDNQVIWNSEPQGNAGSRLKISKDRVWIETSWGWSLWSQPLNAKPPSPPIEYPDPNGALQYYAYYYPWYTRGDWSRHGYQDEPLMGKYGTDEVAVAEQHIEWALQTGITSWIVSWWGPNSMTMNHFKAGMMNAESLSKIKFCMLYETPILDGRGNWYDGTLEEALFEDLKVIRDEFFDHPSYLRINDRPVIIFYITRAFMDFQFGFDGPSVLANMRRRLGHEIYFIADEPFFNAWNERPDENGNAFVNRTQVFDAYTTYNMYTNRRARDGETATEYQLREAMPIWKRWAEQLPFFPNVMAQYYDFRGHKPLLGNSADFMFQLREVACLPRTNFNGAPHIMFITSFNEWWEGTQIEPENGDPANWSTYGFSFMETLAEFKKEVDSVGPYWCDEGKAGGGNNGTMA